MSDPLQTADWRLLPIERGLCDADHRMLPVAYEKRLTLPAVRNRLTGVKQL